MSFTIFICDAFSQEIINNLMKNGFNVVYKKCNGETLKNELAKANPEVLIVRSTKVDASHIGASPALKCIIRAGAGYDNIDLKSANAHGIFVGNCPGKNSIAVAELLMGLMLSLDRKIADNVISLRNEKKWNKEEFSKAKGIKGQTLGILGFGAIGRAVGERALSFEMRVIAYDVIPFTHPKIERYTDQEKLIRESDILTLHVPSLPSTKGMINHEFLSKMKKDATLLNCARGDLTNEKELIEFLNQNKSFKYGCDVYADEPAEKCCVYESALAKHPQVYGTHHIGASTNQAEDAIGKEAERMIYEYKEKGVLPNIVNLQTSFKTLMSLNLKYKNVECLYTHIFSVLKEEKATVINTNLQTFTGNQTGVGSVIINKVEHPEAIIEKLKKCECILAASYQQL